MPNFVRGLENFLFHANFVVCNEGALDLKYYFSRVVR